MNWTQAPFPVAPWDAPGLPPRTMDERCQRHRSCAYRDDDPNRCPLCHATPAKCRGEHDGAPADKWSRGLAGVTSGSLKAGQYNDPRQEANGDHPVLSLRVVPLCTSRPPFPTPSRRYQHDRTRRN